MARKKTTAGRPPIHPPEDHKRTMVRSTEEEELTWHEAASRDERAMGLPEGKLTIGPWSRSVLNAAAKIGLPAILALTRES